MGMIRPRLAFQNPSPHRQANQEHVKTARIRSGPPISFH